MNDSTDYTGRGESYDSRPGAAAKRNGTVEAPPPGMELWPLAELLLRRWPWPVLLGLALAAAAVQYGRSHWNSSYTATAQLIAYNSPNAAEVFGQRQVAKETLMSVLRSPALLAAAGARTQPPVSAAALAERLTLIPDRNSDIIVAAVTDTQPAAALELANLYAAEAVRFTQKLQGGSAEEIDRFFSQQLTNIEAQISSLDKLAGSLPVAALSTTNALRPYLSLAAQYRAAQEQLVELKATYTEAHPHVLAQRAKLKALEGLMTPNTPEGETNGPVSAADVGAKDPLIIRGQLESLEQTRLALQHRRQAAQVLGADPPGFCRVLAPATLKGVVAHKRETKIVALAALAGMVGALLGVMALLLAEVADERLKTVSDVRRVTRLPVLAAAGNLNRMSERERSDWAFRTWTRLQGNLSPSPNHGLVFGITSARSGEGRSTWVRLLAEAASLLGFRVLTIATCPSPGVSEARKETELPEDNVATATGEIEFGLSIASATVSGETASVAVAPRPDSNVLAAPAQVAEKLARLDSQPVVHIPLPGWVWNLERRKQWREALHHWSNIENIVILVELPPASVPEAVLLAENLPNVVWLTASGKAAAAVTREYLETLRHARCHLAGAVLNRERPSFLQKRFGRWLNCA